jgi:anti-anti-sigma factor
MEPAFYMSLSVIEAGEKFTVLALDGRLDAGGVNAVQAEFRELISSPGKAVLIDISQVTFLASLGIRMVVEAAKTVRGSGGSLVLLKPRSLVESSLKSAGLEVILGISHDEAAARLALGA